MARKGEDSPAMRHFRELKQSHADALLLYQIGDFYETFFDDAKLLASTLGIVLTARGEDSLGEPIPMAGFPLRALDQHLPRLLEAGLRVAICEQVEDAADARGMVKREITRVVTPGTVLEESLLDARRPTLIACFFPLRPKAAADTGEEPIPAGGLAWAELSTGRFLCAELEAGELAPALARLEVAELLLPEKLWSHDRPLLQRLRPETRAALTAVPDFAFDRDRSHETLTSHFGVSTLQGFGFERHGTADLCAAGALLAYLIENQRGKLGQLRAIERFETGEVMALDAATLAALEIVRTLRGGERRGSLLDCLDETLTPMGAREIRGWLTTPLRDPRKIAARHGAVDELVHTPKRLRVLREALSGLPDLERLAGKLGSGRAGPRDLANMREALQRLPMLGHALSGSESTLLSFASDTLDALHDARALLEARLADDPPANLRDGGAIRPGLDAELDELRSLGKDGKAWIARFQEQESARTGIPLKVGYNNVFGYYIEITHRHAEKVPENYIRKQTLKAAERYITPELKDYEARILNAERRIQSLETQLFQQLRDELVQHAGRLLSTARLTALVDGLAGLAQVAASRGWRRPTMTDGADLRLLDARHPVLEQALERGELVPNDLLLNDRRTMAIVTGPNMAGKSTYVRTVAVCVLLAQAGSFVPAREAVLGFTDRIFTRLGSADDIGRGQSTFMVEMAETANILNHATERSLIVLDEVGRGTSTFDGVSIAWAVSEHLLKLGARTLFATHYHELTQLAGKFPEVCNLNVAVREWEDKLVFLHKIVEGAADRSYGIHVARLAGIPGDVVQRADAILQRLEADSPVLSGSATQGAGPALKRPRKAVQLSLFSVGENQAMRALRELDAASLTPEQALAELLRLRDLAHE